MQVANTDRAWGAVTQTFHWTLATMVLAQLLIGDVMLITGPRTVPGLWYYVHPTVGILIGVLMVARLAWREANPVPAMPQDITLGKQALSRITHYGFYGLLIVNPLIGWLLVGAMGEHVHFFSATLPDLLGQSRIYRVIYFWMHLAAGGGVVLLFLVHAAGALQHEFLKKDNVLRRMLGVLPMTPARQAVQDDVAMQDEYPGERDSALVSWAEREALARRRRALPGHR